MVSCSKNAYDVKKSRPISTIWSERKICSVHKEQKWWISRSGVRICAICAAPPDRMSSEEGYQNSLMGSIDKVIYMTFCGT